MSVASKQLAISDALGGGVTTLYSVPTGKRTIVKSLVCTNLGGAAAAFIFYVKTGATEDASFNVRLGASGSSNDSVMLLPWIVLEVGQSLAAQMTAGTGRLIVSGTELTL